MLKRIFKSQFLRSSTLSLVIHNVNNALNYALTIIARWTLGTGLFGVWTGVSAMLPVLNVPVQAFITEVLNKVSYLASEDQREAHQYYLNTRKAVFKMTAGLLLISPLLVWLLHILFDFESIWIGWLLVASIILQLYFSVAKSYLQGSLRIGAYTIATVIFFGLRALVTITLLYLSFELFALPLGYLATITISSVIVWKLAELKIDPSEIGKVQKVPKKYEFKGVLWNIPFVTALMLFLNVDIILASSQMTALESDLYGVISSFGQIFHYGPISFASLLIPYVARQGRQKLTQTAALVFGMSILACGFFWLCAPLFLQLLKSEEQIFLVPIILWYGLYIALYNVLFLFIQYLLALRDYKRLVPLVIMTIIYSVALVVVDPAWFNLVGPLEGFVGVNLTMVIITVILTAIMVYTIKEEPKKVTV